MLVAHKNVLAVGRFNKSQLRPMGGVVVCVGVGGGPGVRVGRGVSGGVALGVCGVLLAVPVRGVSGNVVFSLTGVLLEFVSACEGVSVGV